MKVLIAGNYSRNLVIFRGPLINELVGRGHAVVAVGPENDSWVNDRLREMRARFVMVPLGRASVNPLRDLQYLWRLVRLIGREQPDVVLTFTHKPNIFGAFAALLAGHFPSVLLIEGLGYAFINVTGRRKRIAHAATKFLYRMAFRSARQVFFLNSDDLALFRSENILPARLPTPIIDGIGVDLHRFRYWAPGSDVTDFLMIARMLKTKGIEEFCEAARIVKRTFPDRRFSIVGTPDPSSDGFPFAPFKQYIDDGVILWTEQANDVEEFYRRCSVYVLPSYREGMPVTVMEAMATGRAVITTDVPGCRTTVEHGVTGVIVPPRDVEALAAAMLMLVRAPELAREMGRAGRRVAEARFDASEIAREQANILEGVGKARAIRGQEPAFPR